MSSFPRFVEWELTGACDLRCAHCHRAGSRQAAEPDFGRVQAIVAALLAAGVESVALSGGEPTLSPHLWPVVERLKTAGAFVSLITNGRADSADFALRCRESGLDFVWLSLDGPEAVHDAVRGWDGVFSRLMRTRGNLAMHGVRFGFMTTLLRANAARLEALHDLVREAGADLWQLQFGLPAGTERELFLTPGELSGLRPAIARLREREPRLLIGEALAMALDAPQWIRSGDSSGPAPAWQGGCPSGRLGLAIAPDGRLRGCSCLPDDGAGLVLTGDGTTPEAQAAHLVALARKRERTLAPAALGVCGELSASGGLSFGFCHALALRSALHPEQATAITSKVSVASNAAATAAVAVFFSGLMACSSSKAPAEDKTTPPEAGPPANMTAVENTPPPTEPEVAPTNEPMATTDATPAGKAPDQSTTNVVAPSSDAPGMKPAEWKMPKCCMMHVLVPDCVCSPPPGTIPVP